MTEETSDERENKRKNKYTYKSFKAAKKLFRELLCHIQHSYHGTAIKWLPKYAAHA